MQYRIGYWLSNAEKRKANNVARIQRAKRFSKLRLAAYFFQEIPSAHERAAYKADNIVQVKFIINYMFLLIILPSCK